MTTSSTIVQRVWNYCNVLRDDGVSYGDYLEQLTYLLFLKMDDEARLLGKPSAIPADLNWQSLLRLDGDALESHYRHILDALGVGSGLIPVIFRKAQNKIQDPAKLRRLVDLINGETWTGLDIDVKGSIYEGLLEKNAQDTKSGAGQYFTPRPLIQAMVDVIRPRPGEAIADPACGTGGFLLAAHDYIADPKHYGTLDKAQWHHLRHAALHGWEIVDNTARLCVMNLYLHGIGANGGTSSSGDAGRSPIHVADSLAADPGDRFPVILTNPPFGKKSSVTFVNEDGEVKRESQVIVRQDFWTSTAGDERPRRRRRARQRPLRRRRRRGRPPQAAPRLRRPHLAAPAHRPLLRPGRQGQCALLRPPPRLRARRHQHPVDLRPAHQPELHPQAEPAHPRRPGRVRPLL
jgi:type I restriction enzyme M protein